MRKVVTGEQVAQLYNPDPFALPRLAGPGLPDPGRDHHPGRSSPGCWAWLVRLIARHPLAASILALAGGHLAESGLGRPRRPGRRRPS